VTLGLGKATDELKAITVKSAEPKIHNNNNNNNNNNNKKTLQISISPLSLSQTRLLALYPGPAGTRKVKTIWILLKQGTVSGSGISWDTCESAPHSKQITTAAPHHSVSFTGRMPFLLPNQEHQIIEGTAKID